MGAPVHAVAKRQDETEGGPGQRGRPRVSSASVQDLMQRLQILVDEAACVLGREAVPPLRRLAVRKAGGGGPPAQPSRHRLRLQGARGGGARRAGRLDLDPPAPA